MTQPYKFIGKGRPLVDGQEKVMGIAQYTADLKLPGMVHGRPILSPHAHANIVSIDTSLAEALPGVVAILTAADLPTKDQVITSRSTAVLAKGKVMFVGQPVAIVVAETPEIAADAAELVTIDYEPLPAAIRLHDAIQPEAPTIWPDGLPSDEGEPSPPPEHDNRLNNVSADTHFTQGDVETGFAESDIIIEHSYHSSHVHQGYLEPHACLAMPQPIGDGVTIYTCTQGKFAVRDTVAKLLSLPHRDVHIVPMTIGGGFGAKYVILEPLTAAVALAVQRPVRIVLTRSEDFLTSSPAPGISIELKTGAKQDGTITALQARVLVDNGLFNFNHGGIVASLFRNIYKIPHIKVSAFEVNTNKPPIGAYRAPGGPQTIFALESNIDEMAAALGIDQLDFRLQNVAANIDGGDGTEPMSLNGFKQCFARLKSHPAWQDRQRVPNEGTGLAVAGWVPSVGTADAICRVDEDGAVSVEVGYVDVSGNDSSFVLIAAEALGVDPADVVIIHGDTTGGPYGPISGGSQVTYTSAGAVDAAAQQAKGKLLQLAAEQFEAAPEDVELVAGRAQVKGVPDRSISIGELAKVARESPGSAGPIVGQGHAALSRRSPAVSIHLVRVKVDPGSGEVQPIQHMMVQDVGLAINPLIVEGQLHGGMVQGMGIGLREAMVYDEGGQLLTGTFMDYATPNSTNISALEAILIENPSPDGPFGARGVGEPPILGGAAAVANAIKDATGIRVTSTPIRSELLWHRIQNR